MSPEGWQDYRERDLPRAIRAGSKAWSGPSGISGWRLERGRHLQSQGGIQGGGKTGPRHRACPPKASNTWGRLPDRRGER